MWILYAAGWFYYCWTLRWVVIIPLAPLINKIFAEVADQFFIHQARQLHQREFVSMTSLGSLGSLKMGFTSFSPIILHSLIFVWCTTYSHGHPLPLKKDYYWPWWPPSSRSIPGGVFLNFQLQGTLQHSKFRSSMGLEYARNCLWMWMWLVCHLRSVIWFSSSSVCKTWGGVGLSLS